MRPTGNACEEIGRGVATWLEPPPEMRVLRSEGRACQELRSRSDLGGCQNDNTTEGGMLARLTAQENPLETQGETRNNSPKT